MAFLREKLGEGVLSSRHLHALPANARVTIAGLVVARQRPMTARGIVFLLLEDEFGMWNVLIQEDLADERRDIVRLAPFVIASGILEKRAVQQRTLVAESIHELLAQEVLAMPKGKSWA